MLSKLILVVLVIIVGVVLYVRFSAVRVAGGDARALVAQGATLLDVRSPEEFGGGHINGAINIPVQELDARLDELSGLQGTEVVMHCETGVRAAYADRLLRDQGFDAIRQLDGHMREWRARGMPVTPAGCISC